MRSLLNAIQEKNKFKVISFPTHERYQSDMDLINADFYLLNNPPHIKKWNYTFSQLPSNHYLMPEEYFPYGFDFDFVLSQNRFGQFQLAQQIASKYEIPLINLEHTLPLKTWTKRQFYDMKNLRGHINLYISKFSAKKWEEPEPIIIPHCVNSEIFKPKDLERNNHILTVANDYIGRDSVLGFSQYKKVTKDLKTFPVGDTLGFSKAAKSIEELSNFYSNSRIFLNTSTWSPIPKSLLEAMSSGCAVVSTNNCAIPDYIDHGINGLLANSDDEMRMYLEKCTKDKDLCMFLGENARKTIIEKCSKENFTNTWNKIFIGLNKKVRHNYEG